MSDNVKADFTEMEKKLKLYVDKGRVTGAIEVREEPVISAKPDISLMKPLKRIKSFNGHFLAVDCSTRTLKRANNWGIYLLRVSYALVKGRQVDWGYEEKICTEIGDAHTRGNALTNRRIELESETALKFLYEENTDTNHNSLRNLDKGDYILLDGASFFGGKRGFWVSLYDESFRRDMNLLCVSKQSPALHDERGRDFIATTCAFSSYPIWVYYSVGKANRDKHLYGDVSIIKLCEDSPRAFRCDVMEYLASRQIDELISPLTSVSEDPRCLGYPVPLWLAHDFTAPSDAKLLNHLDQIDKRLASIGILNTLRAEELSCSFADELHGVRYPFKREMVGNYV